LEYPDDRVLLLDYPDDGGSSEIYEVSYAKKNNEIFIKICHWLWKYSVRTSESKSK